MKKQTENIIIESLHNRFLSIEKGSKTESKPEKKVTGKDLVFWMNSQEQVSPQGFIEYIAKNIKGGIPDLSGRFSEDKRRLFIEYVFLF